MSLPWCSCLSWCSFRPSLTSLPQTLTRILLTFGLTGVTDFDIRSAPPCRISSSFCLSHSSAGEEVFCGDGLRGTRGGSVSNVTIVLRFVHCRLQVQPEVPQRPRRPPPPPPPPRGDTGNFPSPRGIHGGGGVGGGGRTKLQRLLLQKQNCGVGGVAVGAGRGTRHREEADNAASTQGCNSIPFVQIWTSTVAIQHKSQIYM